MSKIKKAIKLLEKLSDDEKKELLSLLDDEGEESKEDEVIEDKPAEENAEEDKSSEQTGQPIEEVSEEEDGKAEEQVAEEEVITKTEATPEEIHEVASSEISTLRDEMAQVIAGLTARIDALGQEPLPSPEPERKPFGASEGSRIYNMGKPRKYESSDDMLNRLFK